MRLRIENSLPTATAIRLKKSLESHSIMILEENIRKRIENIIEIVSSIEPDVAEQPEKSPNNEVVAEVVAEQPEVVAEQPK
jgi:hypothetical protein